MLTLTLTPWAGLGGQDIPPVKLGHKPLGPWAQPPNLSLGQEENCPQQERTHRESGTHTEWALRERKHQGSHPRPGIRAPRPRLSIPTLFGEPGPPHLERSQATLRKGNFISINTR